MKNIFTLIVLFVACIYSASAQSFRVDNFDYAQRDTTTLTLDVYTPQSTPKLNKTVLYVFGGGFVEGSKNDADNVKFYKTLLLKGYTVVAIDYRLGLKGVKNVGVLHPKAPFKAIKMATEDLISATKFIVDNNKLVGVDTSKIVLVGSSAGAITVLRADYELTNRTEMVSSLPESFRYAGVVSMAGALFTDNGKPRYMREPAPTFMLHGTKDKVVFYGGVKMFNLSVAGTAKLTKIFEKNKFNYWTYRFKGATHEVATFPRVYLNSQIEEFIQSLAFDKRKQQLDVLIFDSYVRENFKSNVSLNNLYN